MIPLYTSQNGHHKQINKQQVLGRVWTKGNPSALLMGMQTRAATVESNMEMPQKLNMHLPFHPAILVLEIYPKKTKTIIQKT